MLIRPALRLGVVVATLLLLPWAAPGPAVAGPTVPPGLTVEPPMPPGFLEEDLAFLVDAADLGLLPQHADLALENGPGGPVTVVMANGRYAFAADVWISNTGAEDIDLRDVLMVFDTTSVEAGADPAYVPIIVPTTEILHGGAFEIVDGVDGPAQFAGEKLNVGFVTESDPSMPMPDILAHNGCTDAIPEAPLRGYDLSPLGVLEAPQGAGPGGPASRRLVTIAFDLTFMEDEATLADLRDFTFCGDFFRPAACSNPLIVDDDLLIDLSTDPPTVVGEPAVAPYVSVDKSNFWPGDWRVVIDVGNRGFRLTNMARIVVQRVDIATFGAPDDGGTPGLDILSGCDIVIDADAEIVLADTNAWAGGIRLLAHGDVVLDGFVTSICEREESGSVLGVEYRRASDVTLASRDGAIQCGADSRILTAGWEAGNVTLSTCSSGGEIFLAGEIASDNRRLDSTSQIRIAAMQSTVTIDGSASSHHGVHARGRGTEVTIQGDGDVTVWGNEGGFRGGVPGTVAATPAQPVGLGQTDHGSFWYVYKTCDYQRSRKCHFCWDGRNFVCCWWETSRQCRNVWVRRTRLLRDDEGVGHGSIRIVSVHGAVAVYDHAVDSAARFNGDGRCVLAGRMGITVGLTGTEDRVVVDAGGGYEGSGGEVALHATHGPVYVGPGAQVLADNPLAGWAGGTDGYVHITVGGGVSQFDNEGVVLPSPGVIFAGGELIPPLSGCLVPFAE